ncbi:UNVERIFIED_CONTAM: hypothetical protein Sindi_0467100 [Sesamum indicum]
MQKRKLEIELNQSAKKTQLFENFYKKKETTAGAGRGLLRCRIRGFGGNDGSTVWLAAAVGKNKDRVFVLGFEAHIFSRTFTSPSPPPSPQLNPTMEDRINLLETMMADMMAMIRKMRATSSTDPPTSIQDDMHVADKEGLD